MSDDVLQLSAKASGFARRGRPWFFRDDLTRGDAQPARLVRVIDENERDLGLGITSKGKLALRLCGPWEGDGVPDRETFFARRLASAVAARGAPLGLGRGVRIAHAEADWLPGLVVDLYDRVAVLQSTSAYVEQSLDAIVPWLAENVAKDAVIARNDVAARKHEGLAEHVELLHGRRVEKLVIDEGSVHHIVRPFSGHKTGFYLDQAPARALVQKLAKGRRVLDLFCYQGAFSLHALQGGATSALAIDQSEEALATAREAAENFENPVFETRHGDVFDELRSLRERNQTFDLVVLDPPAFAKSRREISGAERGYRDLNRQALRLLAENGYLVTCTCSHHMSLPRFEEIVRQACAGLPFRVALRERLGAGPDHPALLTHPESEYLKVLLVQRVD